jgi:acetyltransferase-like isoleucine patch superfamily enzyme
MSAIVSPNTRIRYPECFAVGDRSVIDDFCYFSTKVTIGRCSHIASGCSVAGGVGYQFTLGDFSSLSSGVKVWCASNDYVNDLIALVPQGVDLGDSPVAGDVTFANYTGVGANAVVMPDNDIPEGVAIGALSLVPPSYAFEPWTVYAGIPIRPLRARNRSNVLAQVERLGRSLSSSQSEADSLRPGPRRR